MSLADAFAGMKEAQGSGRSGAQVPKGLSAQAPMRPKLLSTQVPERPPMSLQGTAKSRHPDFAAVKIFVRKRTHKAAARKWEDDHCGDFSDLVEKLLSEYLST